jgi:CO/xanthine dehydrogenase Mo-binding subunit
MSDATSTRPEYRSDGPSKVTGKATYAADFDHDGALEVAFTRSPLSHARILSVDTSEAEVMPGVRAVVTGRDLEPLRLGRRLQDWAPLALDRVRMVGERVAAVAAETPQQAEAAARAIDVRYEELEPVFDRHAAVGPDAPILHPEGASYTFIGGETPVRSHPNVQGELAHEHGDVDAGFAAAAHVFEHTFELPKSLAGYLEPKAAMAWIEDEVINVITTNKSPFRLREQLAVAMGIPEGGIVVKTGSIGGDFGGKGLSIDEYVLVHLARTTGRRVRTVTGFADDMSTTTTRHAGTLRLRTAVAEDGRFLAHEASALIDGGAYAAGKPNPDLVPPKFPLALAGYHVPAARLDAKTVYTNTVPGGNARSPGQPQSAFAGESHIDLIAHELDIDPLELRLRNAIRPGQPDVAGSLWETSTMSSTLRALQQEMSERPLRDGFARGVAAGTRALASGAGAVRVAVTADANVVVLTGISDQGGGALTMLQRVAARELGIDEERIIVKRGDTAEALWDKGVGGSRVTPIIGGATRAGAIELKARLDALAPDRSTMQQLALAAEDGGFEVVGEFTHPSGVRSTAACFADVAVDEETGAITVAHITIVADVGTVINPLAARGQIVGGLANGLGFAMTEELVIEDGRVVGPNLNEYKIPTMADMPELHVVLLQDDKGPGPFGAKSTGELSNYLVAPAIANAVQIAAGVRVTSLPMTAEKVYDMLGMNVERA